MKAIINKFLKDNKLRRENNTLKLLLEEKYRELDTAERVINADLKTIKELKKENKRIKEELKRNERKSS